MHWRTSDGKEVDFVLVQGRRMAAFECKCTERRPHPMPETARMHGMLHFAAESQLFSSSDKARADLERMLLAGMSRHEAIHRMGVPLVERVIEMLDIMRSPPRRKGRKTRSTPKNKPTAKKKLTGKKKR
jgi:hypothetical protein